MGFSGRGRATVRVARRRADAPRADLPAYVALRFGSRAREVLLSGAGRQVAGVGVERNRR